MSKNETVRAKIKRYAPIAITAVSVATTAVVLHKYTALSRLEKENLLLVLSPANIQKLLTEGGAFVYAHNGVDFIVKAIPQ